MSALAPHILAFRTLAAKVDDQADIRRQQSMNAQQRAAPAHGAFTYPDKDELERWALSYATAYQTLTGLAAALRDAADELEAEMHKRLDAVKTVPCSSPPSES